MLFGYLLSSPLESKDIADSITGHLFIWFRKFHSVPYNVYNCIRLVPHCAQENHIRNTVSMMNSCNAVLRKIGFQDKYDLGLGFNSCAYDCHCKCLSGGVCVMTD